MLSIRLVKLFVFRDFCEIKKVPAFSLNQPVRMLIAIGR
jgi:hypothetical protein